MAETDALKSLSGFGLDQVLGELQLPAGSSRLGLGGFSSLAAVGRNGAEDEDAVGLDQGVDYEDQVDMEMGDEIEDYDYRTQYQSSAAPLRQKRVRVVKKLKPRPKTVNERFPAFKNDAVLNFSELFKGFTVNKSRVLKRPVSSASPWSFDIIHFVIHYHQLSWCILVARSRHAISWTP